MKFVSNFLLLPGFRRWINDGINVGITEGELDRIQTVTKMDQKMVKMKEILLGM